MTCGLAAISSLLKAESQKASQADEPPCSSVRQLKDAARCPEGMYQQLIPPSGSSGTGKVER